MKWRGCDLAIICITLSTYHSQEHAAIPKNDDVWHPKSQNNDDVCLSYKRSSL